MDNGYALPTAKDTRGVISNSFKHRHRVRCVLLSPIVMW
jgi:hypothetical protein